jgi:hypothetical protein
LVQIVPGAVPLLNGVGDFALTIARALRRECGVGTRFLVGNPGWAAGDAIEGFPAQRIDARSSSALLEALSVGAARTPVLLQLSPYGYDRQGVPAWLLEALAAWKRLGRGRSRLITYFHELYAMGPPWRRSFWMSPLQRRCVRRIAGLSDHSMTNLSAYARRLMRWQGDGTPIDVLPVVSSVGEPAAPPETHGRRMLVWGSAAAKQEIYGRHRRALERVVGLAGISSIVEVGPRSTATPRSAGGVSIDALGVLEAATVAGEIAACSLGVVSYNPECLAKSSIFAAYCAHRRPALVLPFATGRYAACDGLEPGTHFLPADADASALQGAALWQVAEAAQGWYAGHASARHAHRIAEVLREFRAPA